MKRLFILLSLSISFAASGQGLSYRERAEQYIQEHKDWAIAEQRRSGIPAAITLAQGVHETDAGASELATKANNHFGIKCKKEWTGETFAHDDDAPQECFRKYRSAIESYRDHSDYLKGSKRYESCFALDATDYAGWARELRRCGYATNPAYAQKLIGIIEDYHLQDYTIAAMSAEYKPATMIASAASPVESAMMADEKHTAPGEVVPDRDTPTDRSEYGKVIRRDGLRGFWARKGDVLLEYAIQYKVRYAKLLEINNLPDAPLATDQFIYLERGGAVDRMIAKDVSAPAPTPAATPPAAQANTPPPAAPVQQAPAPAMTTADATPSSNALASTNTTAIAPPVATASAPVHEMSASDAAATAEARIFASAASPSPAAKTAPEANAKPADTNTEKPFNIASEKTVEEQKTAEPQDEFSRLKARLDKVVYAPARPAPAPAAAATSAMPEPVPAGKAVAAGPVYHTVKSGETAFGISRQYGITMQQLMDMNKLSFGNSIRIGQKLRVK
jgi:LysM repeat protein